MSLVEEYFSLQEEYENKYGDKTIVLLEKGMFYEVYAIDNESKQCGKAQLVSQLLNIALTRANKKIIENNESNPLMTGFPVVSLKKNIKVLLDNGYTVITFDQQKDPSDRKVSTIYSPGTYIDECTTSNSNWICSLYISLELQCYSAGISFIDLTTGVSNVFELNTEDRILFYEDILRIIESYASQEYSIINKDVSEKEIARELNGSTKQFHFNYLYSNEISNINYQNEFLSNVYENPGQLTMIESFDMERMQSGTISFINILQFCHEHNADVLKYVAPPVIFTDENKLILHNNALYQLNIVSQGKREKGITCLADVVDNTSTPLGKRKLKKDLLSPITNVESLIESYNKIDTMMPLIDWYESHLKCIIDIERYHRKMSLNKLSPSEYANLQSSYESINVILNQKFSNHETTQTFNEYYRLYLKTFNLAVMKSSTSDDTLNIFNEGVYSDLDDIQKGIKKINEKIEMEGKKLSNLLNHKENIIKFEYAAKSGYSFYSTLNRCEQLQKLPSVKSKYNFKKESKTKCCISSDNLNIWIDQLSRFQNEFKPLIMEHYTECLETMFNKYSSLFSELNTIIEDVDVVKSKAKTAKLNDYCRPEITDCDSSFIYAKNMRHAIIECLDTDCDYVPNDITIDKDNCGILLYGVNGSGKSCYSKAVGLCIVLAQSGHYVPCNSFSFSPFTKLYTRITGDDNIFRGHSSFFVEMSELKSILNYADNKSIVIGDEVCKGTEDVSAVAIVGTAIKYLIEKEAKFIFATHLHKLPHISILKDETKLNIKHISVEFDETTIFTRTLKDGTGDMLYGLEIAHSILKNESFHSNAFNLRNELLNKSSKLVADKKSKYNGNLYINHCQICGSKESLEAHHIVFQSKSKIRKDRKSNLVVLCEKHHDDVHANKLIVEGWKTTIDGKMLKYTEN